jgi:hypothetical protein
MDNVFLLALLIWPLVVILSALANMLISWSFSWQELVLNYLIGMAIGICFYYGTNGPPDQIGGAAHFFLTVSLGFFGLLNWAGVEALRDPGNLFWASSVSVVLATILSGGLDRLAIHAIGRTPSVGNTLLSIVTFCVKIPFALITTVVGTLIGIVGAIVAATKPTGGFGFIGGVFYSQWGLPGSFATTFSSYVNVWQGPAADVIDHELYHTRQYIYMQDWLGVMYFTVAAVWGLISSAASGSFDASRAFNAVGDVGNPIEVAAYKLNWT